VKVVTALEGQDNGMVVSRESTQGVAVEGQAAQVVETFTIMLVSILRQTHLKMSLVWVGRMEEEEVQVVLLQQMELLINLVLVLTVLLELFTPETKGLTLLLELLTSNYYDSIHTN
jgi:hypothetical protein